MKQHACSPQHACVTLYEQGKQGPVTDVQWADRPALGVGYSVDGIFCLAYNLAVAWDVEFTDEFGTWWENLTAEEQESVDFGVGLLIERGPTLPFPYSSQVKGSQFGEMRELRVQHQGKPYRVLYAFDPRRVALLLLGGDKTGDDGWYERMVPTADKLFAEHVADLKKKQQ
jgi:hypothetical protein